MIPKKRLIEVALPSDAINAAAQEVLLFNGWVVARGGVGKMTAEKAKEVPDKADCSEGQK